MRSFFFLSVFLLFTSCSLFNEFKQHVSPVDFNEKVSLGMNESSTLASLGAYQHRLKDGQVELLLYRTGFVQFERGIVTDRGNYRYGYRSDLPFTVNVRSFSNLFELCKSFGSPLKISSSSEFQTVFYNNGAIFSNGTMIYDSIGKLYTEDLIFKLGINAFADGEVKNEASYLIMPGDKNINPHDLQFKEVRGYLEANLKQQGLDISHDPMKADYILLVKYGISDPKEDIKVVSSPVFIPSYLPGRTTNFYSGFNFIGSVQTQGTWSSQYAGQRTETFKTVSFNRWINMEAVDNQILMKQKVLKPVWKVLVNSNGSTGDLRFVLPALTFGAGHFINQDTSHQLDFTVHTSVLNQYIYDTYSLSNSKKRSLAGQK